MLYVCKSFRFFKYIYRYTGYLAQGCRVEGLGSGSTLGKWKRTAAHEQETRIMQSVLALNPKPRGLRFSLGPFHVLWGLGFIEKKPRRFPG